MDRLKNELIQYLKSILSDNKSRKPQKDDSELLNSFPFNFIENLEEIDAKCQKKPIDRLSDFERQITSDENLIKIELEKTDPISVFKILLSRYSLQVPNQVFQNFEENYGAWLANSTRNFNGDLFGEESPINPQTDIESIKLSADDFKAMVLKWYDNNLQEIRYGPIELELTKADETMKYAKRLIENTSSTKYSDIAISMIPNHDIYRSKSNTNGESTDERFYTVSENPGSNNNDDFQAMLLKTISEYEYIKGQKQNNSEDTSIIEKLILNLRAQLNKLKPKPVIKKPKEKTTEERIRIGFHEVFSFYACQQNLQGLHQPFETIKRNAETLNIAKFTKFCQDFRLCESSIKSEPSLLPKNVIKQIFIKHAKNHRDMDETIFEEALQAVSVFYFNTEYDKLNDTNYQDLTPSEKKDKLFEVLSFQDRSVYLKKCNGFSQPFGPDQLTRIPKDDIANKYDLKKKQRLRQTVLEWKKTKSIEREDHKKTSATPVISHKVPSDAIFFSTKPQISSLDTYKSKMGRKNSDPLTWKGLGNMSPLELIGIEEDFKYENLIVSDDSSSDEYLKKEYPLSQSQVNLDLHKEVDKSPKTNMSKSPNKLSTKTLIRAGQLSEVSKKNEERIIQKGLKLANARIQKLNKYSTKLTKL